VRAKTWTWLVQELLEKRRQQQQHVAFFSQYNILDKTCFQNMPKISIITSF